MLWAVPESHFKTVFPFRVRIKAARVSRSESCFRNRLEFWRRTAGTIDMNELSDLAAISSLARSTTL